MAVSDSERLAALMSEYRARGATSRRLSGHRPFAEPYYWAAFIVAG